LLLEFLSLQNKQSPFTRNYGSLKLNNGQFLTNNSIQTTAHCNIYSKHPLEDQTSLCNMVISTLLETQEFKGVDFFKMNYIQIRCYWLSKSVLVNVKTPV